MNLSFSTRGWPDLSWEEMLETAVDMGFSGVAMAAACMVVSPFYLAAAMGFLAIHFYNGEPGERNRVVNYLFYPVCLLVIGLAAMYVL